MNSAVKGPRLVGKENTFIAPIKSKGNIITYRVNSKTKGNKQQQTTNNKQQQQQQQKKNKKKKKQQHQDSRQPANSL